MFNMSDLLNVQVKHTVFGVGTVTEVTAKSIDVQFVDKHGKFVFPDVFEKFLIAIDPALQEALLDYISLSRRIAKEKQKSKLAEESVVEKSKSSEKKPVSKVKKTRNIEDGFDTDYNVKHLAKHPILSYKQVEEQYGIKISGFGRGINRTPSTIVLISSVDKKKTGYVYHDKWTENGQFIYSGEGKAGDQKMSAGNVAIVNAANEGRDIHLFVKFSPYEYYYQGIFELVNYTYVEDLGENEKIRKEYKFHLKRAQQ